MSVHAHDDDDKRRGSYKSGGEGRGGANWTTRPRPIGDTSTDPHHVKSTVPNDYKQVPGWGVDLDPKNRPMFPMELESDVMTARGDVKDWQVPHEKVHMSIEHPNLTPVFGVSCPPRGLSGLLRDYAYKYSEGTNRHWMTLVLADRVDVIESMIVDALRGHPDRYIKERAWGQKLKHRDDMSQRHRYLGLAVGIAGAAVLGLVLRNALKED